MTAGDKFGSRCAALGFPGKEKTDAEEKNYAGMSWATKTST